MKEDIVFIFSPEKNAQLKATRKVGFEDVIYSIQNGKVLDVFKHHNSELYSDQMIMVVDIGGYAYQVPFKFDDSNMKLITIFPSRKCTKKYLGDKCND